jgi:hypothetical protein
MECPICTENIGLCKRELVCGHSYHTECIGRWKQVNFSCPMCRGAAFPKWTLWEEIGIEATVVADVWEYYRSLGVPIRSRHSSATEVSTRPTCDKWTLWQQIGMEATSMAEVWEYYRSLGIAIRSRHRDNN